MTSAAGARAQQVAAPLLQDAAEYGLLSGDDLAAGTSAGQSSSIRVRGRAGAKGTISPGVQASAGRYEQGSGTVFNALASARKAQDYCTNLGGSSLSGQLDGQTLAAGAYAVAGNATLGAGATLTLTGDTATVIVLNVAGSLALANQARVVLDGVLPQHVFWNVTQSLAVASDVSFSGVALTGGSITLTGIHAGNCALLSQGDVTLTDVAVMIGHNWFYASARLTTTCTPQTCTFTLPGGELVRNGSFELYTCPPTWLGANACYWYTPTQGSPDFFHADADAPSHVSVPDNIAGIRHGLGNPSDTQVSIYALGQNTTALTGQGYAGLFGYSQTIIYDQNTGTPTTVNRHEYVAQEIAASLQTTHRYYGEFSVRLAPASGNRVQHLAMAVAPPGYTSQAETLTSSPPNVELAVIGTLDNAQNAGVIASQTGSWQRLGQVFTPNSDRNGFTLMVGNFENAFVANGPTTNASSIPTGIGTPDEDYYAARRDLAKGAYYYLDNVTLSMVTEASASASVTLVSTCPGSPAGTTLKLGTLPMPALVGATYSWSASPNDPSLTQTASANPTVHPLVTTVYTLTVSIPVPVLVNGVQQTQTQTYTSTVTVNVVGYGQTAGATYANPTGGAASDIGAAGSTTTLDGGGGTVTFAGRYHVLGNVRLTNGTFLLTPGTTFFVDGQATRQPSASGVDDRNVQGATITLGDGAQLVVNGATITASGCGTGSPMWRGIVVEGSLPAGIPVQVDIRNGSVISHAYCALTVTQQSYASGGVAYSLTGSAFRHNLTHVLDMGNRKGGTGPALIQNCTFDSDPAQMRYPYNATRTTDRYVTYQALQLLPNNDGNNADAVQVTDNTISHAVYGIVNNLTGTGGDTHAILIAGNTLTNIYQTGIWAPNNHARPQGTGTGSTISDNTVRLSGFGGQVTEQLPDDAPLFGLSTEDSQPGYQRSALRGNDVYGDAGSSKPQVGLNLCYQTDASSNTLADLKEGIRTTTLDASRVFDNATQRCQTGVSVQPSGSYGYQARIGCNSFSRSGASGVLRGIWAVDQADFNDQGTFANPAGNAFAGIDEKVRNDGNNLIKYYQTASLSEDVPVQIAGTRSGTSIKNTQISDGYCSATGSYGNGVRGTLPGLSYIALLADSVRRQLVPRPRRRAYLSAVLHHYLEQGQAATLQAWWATLLPLNPEDYRTTGLWLLHYYDRQPASTLAAERVLTVLQGQAALDADLAAELSLRQVERHLPQTAPRLARADSLTLRAVAWSGTAGAGRAGRWLRYFHPRVELPTPPADPDPLRSPAARPLAPAPSAAPGLPAQLGEAYPNPARTEVQIACQLPADAAGGTLCFTDLVTGRTVREVPVPAGEPAPVLRVGLGGLAPGTYAYRLLVAGRPVAGARKLVVIP